MGLEPASRRWGWQRISKPQGGMLLILLPGHGLALLAVRPRLLDRRAGVSLGLEGGLERGQHLWIQELCRFRSSACGKQDFCLLNVETRVSELWCGGGWSLADAVVATAGLSVQGLASPGCGVVLPAVSLPGDRGGPAGISCCGFGFSSALWGDVLLQRWQPLSREVGDTLRC